MKRPLLIGLLIAACGDARVEAQGDAFRLSLLPHVLDGRVDAIRGARLEILRGGDRLDLGSDTDGLWDWSAAAPFSDERLELHWLVGDKAIARGVTPPLTLEEGERSVHVWVLPPGEPVVAATLLPVLTPHGATGAITPDGDLWLLGGARDIVAGPGERVPASDAIWRLPRDAERPFPTIVGALTSLDGTSDPRVFASATPVVVDGLSRILVIGGRPDSGDRAARDEALLVDPSTATVVDTIPLPRGISEHRAIPLGPSRVLRIGGIEDRGSRDATWSVVDARRRTATAPTPLPSTGGWAPAIAAHPDGGAVLCGGARGRDGETTHQAQDACYLVRPDAQPPLTDLPPLPFPRVGAAAAVLEDGTILVTGGVSGPLEPDDLAVADDAVWALDPRAADWRQAGRMANRRAHHRMLPLDDARVLVLAGVEATSGPPLLALGASAGPAEIIDVVAGTTRELPGTDLLSGGWPVVAEGPEGVVLLLEGTFTLEGRTQGGSHLGLLDLTMR